MQDDGHTAVPGSVPAAALQDGLAPNALSCNPGRLVLASQIMRIVGVRWMGKTSHVAGSSLIEPAAWDPHCKKFKICTPGGDIFLNNRL